MEVPDDVVTVTCTVPADSAGDTAVKEVADVCVTLVAAIDPNLTVAEEVKFVPVIVTEVPPAAGPEVGLIEVIVGAEEVEDVYV